MSVGPDVKAEVPPRASNDGWVSRPDSPPPLEASAAPSLPKHEDSPIPRVKGVGGRGKKAAAPPVIPVLIDQLPDAWDAAHETFDALERCVYERKDMGLSNEQDEMMVCDCVFDRRESGDYLSRAQSRAGGMGVTHLVVGAVEPG